MSRHIPGNQKHLTLEDRIYIENKLNEGVSFKDIARFLCKDPTTISKEVKKHRLSDWYHKGSFYNAKNFVFTDITAVKQTSVRRLSFAVLNVLPVLPATKPARILRKNDADVLTRLPMSVMGAIRKSATVPLLRNINTTHDSLIEISRSPGRITCRRKHDCTGNEA